MPPELTLTAPIGVTEPLAPAEAIMVHEVAMKGTGDCTGVGVAACVGVGAGAGGAKLVNVPVTQVLASVIKRDRTLQ